MIAIQGGNGTLAMTQALKFESSLAGRRVFVTGHTGFTGSWACLWLKSIGVDVAGYSLPPETSPSLFDATNQGDDMCSSFGDICDYERLHDAIAAFKPDLILHLAAQTVSAKVL